MKIIARVTEIYLLIYLFLSRFDCPLTSKNQPMKTTARLQQHVAKTVATDIAGKSTPNPLQLKTTLSEVPSQTMQNPLRSQSEKYSTTNNPLQLKENKTGLPNDLKAGMEALSGYSMDDVSVHYNSLKPAQLNAYAYAQGTDIHLAPGQQEHLPHEAWHVVQQKQGRVSATMQLNGGVSVNDDKGLEKEADRMGEKALFNTTQHEIKPLQQQVIESVIQKKGINFQAGTGDGWHVHKDHIKYNSNNATRINFDNRSRREIGYQLEEVIQRNGLAETKHREDFIECKTWIRDHIPK